MTSPKLSAGEQGGELTSPVSDEQLMEVARRVIRMEAEAVHQLLDVIDDNFLKAVQLVFHCRGRVIVTGLGKSGAVGRKIAATLASTGTSSYFLHAADGLHGDLGVVHRDDVAICLSKSGNSDELFKLLPVFKRLGVPIIAITASPDSMLARYSDVVLNIRVKEEACPHDLAPTTSTTAMLALGDALAMALLEKRQFTREDFAFLHPAGTLGRRLLLKVSDLMETGEERVPKVPPTATMKEAVLEMAAKRGICVVVDEADKILGVMTTGDLNRLVERTEQFFHIPVTEVMNPHPKIIAANTLAYTAYKKMEEYRIIAMPVVDEQETLVGVIHLHDIMRAGIV
ncbi:MAG: KpsF/GutQ family sugar-phosphate isomerase [Calditrichaeota bacterium]|nr:MAG: KpsF/GutQ family sugar-phosphate isomerase [Calditrichota bacterium]